jgi:hypothetical protein
MEMLKVKVTSQAWWAGKDVDILLVHEKGLCDWIDQGCETWDSVTCTCNDNDYPSESGPRDEPVDITIDELSSRAVTIRTRSTKSIKGFYSGSVRGNWIAVDNDAYANAKQAIFNQLAADPRVSFGQVDNLSTKFRAKGQSWRWTGRVTKRQLSEQAHTDYKEPFHRFKNWQGTRFFDFTFYFRVT